MRLVRLWILIAGIVALAGAASAHVPSYYRKGEINNTVKPRGGNEPCANATQQIDQDINNVRARLLNGGDCWWDFSNGRYIVPKVAPGSGQQEVSSLYSGSVWLGGLDPAGNLKLACQDFRPNGNNDFWPGPLRDEDGRTDASICEKWDRHFRVTGEEIRQHLLNLSEGNIDQDLIPKGLAGWPAQGNPFFESVWEFELPTTIQGLAGFFDANNDGVYNPLDGDYPSIDIRGCPLDRYPDEMIFWIYNDEGGGRVHQRTMGATIQMEVQVQAFGYLTADELNDMTFQRYKLINRAVEFIDSCYFAMWVDPDLGCSSDDYIGCDTTKSLMYVYNQDNQDGQPGCNCDDGVPTYCENVPILGVDYFRGPLRVENDTFYEIGMSSFTYYNRPGEGNWPIAMGDPQSPGQFYNYLTGRWSDGSPYTYGGSGYQSGGEIVNYAFTDAPNDALGWSMCSANLGIGDRRTIQASGPFLLLPGAVNELIIGVPWVPEADYPCPDLEGLFRADKLAQGLFDNCFKRLEGPDAPNVDWIELNRELVAVLTNVGASNNKNEGYMDIDFLAPDSLTKNPDPAIQDKAKYRFEGYIIYQLINPNVSTRDYSDPTKARIIGQVDKSNGVSKIYNWEAIEDSDIPTPNPVYTPTLMVDGENAGIRHTFSIKEDRFALGNDRRLVNHKKYYYSVIAYAHNEFAPFDPNDVPVSGQQLPYLAGSRNIEIYTVIPRPVVDFSLQAAYGETVEITRLEGQGAGGNFLDLTEATRDNLFTPGFDSTLTYKVGRGPITVSIFNPFEVRNGRFEVALVDGNMDDRTLDPDARWELRNLDNNQVIASERTIAEINEQIISEYGFSITVAQTGEPGDLAENFEQAAIGGEVEYKDPNQEGWLIGIPDESVSGISPFDFVNTEKLDIDYDFDPLRSLTEIGNGWFVPYVLADWRLTTNTDPDINRMITPAWTERSNLNRQVAYEVSPTARVRQLNTLRNVDIVFTPDKSKWSRCPVIETASLYYTGTGFPKASLPDLTTESPANRPRLMFDTRFSASVDSTDSNNDGIPDPDNSGTMGFGYFPGYAVDVETGLRYIVFFGENSVYSKSLDSTWTGRDMLWNPTSQVFTNVPQPVGDYYNLILGGQHWIYVTDLPYNTANINGLHAALSNVASPNSKINFLRRVQWTGMFWSNQELPLRSLRNGLIPTETRVKIRVNNAYQNWFDEDGGQQPNGHPRYQFTISNKEAKNITGVQIDNSLDSIKAVPNPYYGFSQYETNQYTNTIKITNLPGECTVTIYSLDGKFIRQYKRAETYSAYNQISPALEWDLRNSKGIPVASGVYLIHIDAPGLGERTIKWFGIARQFDPSGF